MFAVVELHVTTFGLVPYAVVPFLDAIDWCSGA